MAEETEFPQAPGLRHDEHVIPAEQLYYANMDWADSTIELGSIFKITFRNGTYRKSLMLDFKDEQFGTNRFDISFFRKNWPRKKWQALFEELKGKCPNAEIIEKTGGGVT